MMAICIKKDRLHELHLVLDYCLHKNIERLVILLLGDYIQHEEGLRKILDTIYHHCFWSVHLIHEGLPYDMTINDLKNIFKDYPLLKSESCLDLQIEGTLTKLIFRSDDAESFGWDDEGYSHLLEIARGPAFYISAVEHPSGDDYWDTWGKSAWHLSSIKDNYLLYMDDGEIVLIEMDHQLHVYAFLPDHGELVCHQEIKCLQL